VVCSFDVSPSFVCQKAKVKGREGDRSDFLFLNFLPSLIYVRIGEVFNRTFWGNPSIDIVQVCPHLSKSEFILFILSWVFWGSLVCYIGWVIGTILECFRVLGTCSYHGLKPKSYLKSLPPKTLFSYPFW